MQTLRLESLHFFVVKEPLSQAFSPKYVEDIIKNESPIKQQNGNWSYKSGDLNVILSPDRKLLITIVTEKE